MGIRDLIMFGVVFAALPFVVARPALGVLLWTWISLMNPHRLSWGPAYDFPFGQVIAVATFLGLLFTKEPRQPKGGAAAIVLLIFVLWMVLTTFFALEPDRALAQLNRVLKIQLFTFIALFALYKREHVQWLLAVLAASVGFYGVKGGLFTIATLGSHRVWGPADSFIADNNALALALVMTIPLFAYFFALSRSRMVRLALGSAIALTAVSALGSYSRGALIAIIAMGGFLWLKGKAKVVTAIALVALGFSLVALMPSEWEDRMMSIGEYKEDASAMGRINTWIALFNLANDRPLVGGGFEPYSDALVARYNPGYERSHSAHSIYFQVLGEHGYVAFFLFLLFWLLTWRMAGKLIDATRNRPQDAWANWLGRMTQVSIVGFLTGGAFLNLAYWDMPYYLMVAVAVATHALKKSSAEQQQAGAPEVADQPDPAAREATLEPTLGKSG